MSYDNPFDRCLVIDAGALIPDEAYEYEDEDGDEDEDD